MRRSILSLGLVLSISLFAQASKTHRHHQAHVHGAGTLSIGLEEKSGAIEFEVSAESLLGFEHTPKSDKDKKAVSDLKAVFEAKKNQMISFDPSLQCQLTKEKMDLVREGKHSDFVAQWSLACEKSPLGSAMNLDFSQFTGLDKLRVTVIGPTFQKALHIEKKPVQVELKP